MNALMPITDANQSVAVALTPEFLRAQLFEKLSKSIHTNDLGLPKYLYRCDLIPSNFNELTPGDQNAYKSAAVLEITYREGYPTFLDGLPVWERMEHEADEDFALFCLYRDSINEQGYRQISSLQAMVHDLNLKKTNETAAIYFWYQRVKAYDLFILAVHRKQRERRIMQVENVHFLEADKILAKMNSRQSAVFSNEKIDAMEPADFVKTMKGLTEIQIQALGIQSLVGAGGKKGSQSEEPPASAEMSVVLRSVARVTHSNDQSETQQGGAGSIMNYINNPRALESAQEFILNMKMGGRSTKEVSERVLLSDERQDLEMIHGKQDDEN